MLIDHSREKLLNTIIYFAKNTNYCGKTKLYKLLYFLDFEHFSVIGRNVTGLEYNAWPKGPVPVQLHNEINSPEPDLKRHVTFSMNENKRLNIIPMKDFDEDLFTSRELRIMKSLAVEYKNIYARDMVEATHLKGTPWHMIYEIKGEKQGKIPYELALDDQKKEMMQIFIEENNDFWKVYA